MPLDVPLTRRALLRAGGMSAALLTLSRVTPAALGQADAPAAAGLRVLGPRAARTFSAIAERITFTGDPWVPRFGQTDALRTVDTALLQLPPDVPQQFSIALAVFDYGPPLFVGKPATFAGLAPAWQDLYLQAWAESRFQTCRLAFEAFKNLSMLGYYSQDATWGAIHYQGPWVVRPRRVPPT